MKKAVESAINKQIGDEFYSAYLYLSMSAFFERMSLSGFAHWMRLQYEEELVHASKLFDFLADNDGHVELQPVAKPPSEFGTPLEIIETALQHEKEVTASIIRLYETAVKESEYPTQIVMQWFIAEQTEEEKQVGDIVAQLKMVGGDGPALLIIDAQLASRTLQAGTEPAV
jgi:ferritin